MHGLIDFIKADKNLQNAWLAKNRDELPGYSKPIFEHIHYDKDGTPGYYEVHSYPIFDSDGSVVQMIEYSIDITKRKEAEEESVRLLTAKQGKEQPLLFISPWLKKVKLF